MRVSPFDEAPGIVRQEDANVPIDAAEGDLLERIERSKDRDIVFFGLSDEQGRGVLLFTWIDVDGVID